MKRPYATALLVLLAFAPATTRCALPDSEAPVSAPKAEALPTPEPILRAIPLLNGIEYPEAYQVEQDCLPHLRDAVVQRDWAYLKELLACGIDPNEHAPDGDTGLTAAIRLGADDMAAYLLLNGADPNVAGAEQQPPIALACFRRHPLLLHLLLEAGADPNAPFAHPLSKSLLAACTDPSLRGDLVREKHITPLMTVAARGDVEAVATLLQYGASTESHTQPSYAYPINFAAERKYLYVMRLLLGRKPESEPHVLITVDLRHQKSWLEVNGKEVLHTIISTGRQGHETPPGRYIITNKYKEWVSTIYKVPMPYFLRLNCSSIGLHSGYVTGEPASHGCIRLPDSIALRYFKLANVGDEVVIER